VKPVVIAGGGLAGLSAGVTLSRKGIPVLLLEQRQSAGGRAASFVDGATGQTIDYGQHVMIAAYRRTLDMLATIGTRHLVSVQPSASLPFHHPSRGFCSFSLPGFGGDISLLAGLLATDLFSAGDKLRILRAGLALAFFRPDRPGAVADMTITQWLDRQGQSPEARRSFWEPLAIAIMNEHIGSASALVFLRSLQTAFRGEDGGASMVIARTGLSDLFAAPAVSFITRNGGAVRTLTDMSETLAEEGRVTGVRLKDGSTVACDALILAVPSYRVRGLLPDELKEAGFLAGMGAIPLSPILSLHMWFVADFMAQEFLGIIDGTAQWVFNRRRIERSDRPGGHVSVVISAAGSLAGRTPEEVTSMAMADLHRVFGKEIGHPTRTIVVREKRATFSCTPGAEKIRPSTATPMANLFLAGDWTATGLPATIEGAVKSGERAAEAAMQFLTPSPVSNRGSR
jgi:squalene-associated FAD-dependent desaturase